MKVSTVVSSNVSSHKSATPCPLFFYSKSLLSSSCFPFCLPHLPIFVLPLVFSIYILYHVSLSLLSLCFIHVCARTARYAEDVQ